MDKMTVKLMFETYEIVGIEVGKYTYGNNLAIQLYSKDEEYGMVEPFATLTVNLCPLQEDNLAFIDTNNCPWATEFIEKYHLGKDTGMTRQSRYCIYPLYEMDLEELKKYPMRY